MAGLRLFILVLTVILIQPYLASNNEIKNGTIGDSNNEEIYIYGDENLTQDNGVKRGSGTLEDPFVLENRTITVTTDGMGIFIWNTSKHLIINNCTLIGDGNNYGIQLYSVKNISIQNCSLKKFSSGIDLSHSSNILISNCSVMECRWDYIYCVYSKTVNFYRLSNVQSLYLLGTENITIFECDISGYISLSNINNVSISNTEASMGFLVPYISGKMPIFFEFNNNTVRGKPVWFSINDITSPPSQKIGQVLFINLSDSTFSWNLAPSISLIEMVHCTKISFEKAIFLNSTIGLNFCKYISFINCTFNGTTYHSSLSSYERYTGCLFIDCFHQFGNGLSLNIINSIFQKTRSSVVDKCLSFIDSKNISINQSLFTSLVDMIRIEVLRSNGVTFTNSTFNSTFIWISEGQITSFDKNLLYRSNIEFSNCRGNFLSQNTISDSSYTGIRFSYSFNNEIIDNLFKGLSLGISLTLFHPGTIITNCSFIDNEIGISDSSSGECIIYNNYFDNEIDICPEYPLSIIWSKKEDGRTNIVNGPNIGGNYWAKYEGIDYDYDGFGDTNIPFGPGDEMPLIDLRKDLSIEDLTQGIPYTGELFEFEFECPPLYPWVATEYNLNISYYNFSNVFLGYEEKIGQVPSNRLLSVGVEIPINASYMVYTMKVEDNYGKNTITNNSMIILDKIPPSILLMESSELFAGEDGWLRLDISDNFALKSVEVTVASNERDNLSNPKRVYRTDEGWMVDFSVDPSCDRIMFTIDAMDVTGLSSSKKLTWMPVVDIIEPVLEFLSPNVAERCQVYNLTFKASDNFDIRSIVVFMSVDGVETSLGYERIVNNIYSSSVYIFDFQGMTSFKVSLEDYQGNRIERTFPLQLKPLDGPILSIDPGSPTTGDIALVSLTLLKPDIYLDKMVCSFDTGGEDELSLIEYLHVLVPYNALFLNFSVTVRDIGGYRFTQFYSFGVIDNDPPVIETVFSDPECGKPFWMETTYTDNLGLVDRGILYDLGVGTIKVLKEVSGRSILDVPHDARLLNITIWAIDGSRNIAYKNISLKVHDGIPPSIVGIASDQYDGMIFITLRADDNLGRSGLTCHLVSPFLSENMTFIYDGEVFKLYFAMMEGATNFSFRIKVSDSSGNSVISDDRWLELPIELEKDHKGKNFLLILIFLAIFTALAAISAIIILFQVRKKNDFNLYEE